MKTNVTLKLDADLLREARVLAAEEGRSINALLTDRLEAMVRERKAFDKARRRALARLREGLDLQWTPPYLTWQVIVNGANRFWKLSISKHGTKFRSGTLWCFKQPTQQARNFCTPRTFPTDRSTDRYES
jgi:hypothetical protein